ncbi:MAG TPA: ABC transporter permease [Vicinamibacteria bacterium]
MLTDLRHALRLLARAPAFTLLCLGTLAFGIGATTALYSVANAVLWRPLPFDRPDELEMVYVKAPAIAPGSYPFSAADVLDFQEHTRSYAAVAAFANNSYDLSGVGTPFRVEGARVTPSLFALLGRGPIAGRVFTAEEDRGGHRVSVLSERLAARLFGSASAAIGRSLSLEGVGFTVIGVMPADFRFPLRGIPWVRDAELWTPISFTERELEDRGDNFNYSVIVRRKPDVSAEQERGDAKRVLAISRAQYPAAMPAAVELLPDIQPLAPLVGGGSKVAVLLLLGAVGFVLLIGCANVANLLLTRALARQGELAVRTALGAGRGRIVRQLLTESVLLALLGGALGFALAYLSIDLVALLAGDALPRSEEIRIDGGAFLFCLAASVAAGILFGLAPAFALGRVDLAPTLKESGRGATSARGRLRGLLVVGEVALALVLLAGAGLLVRTLANLSAADPGFRGDRTVLASLYLSEARYAKWPDVRGFHLRLSRSLATLPGVERVGIATNPPFGNTWSKLYSAEGITKPGDRPTLTRHAIVAGDYFEALSIPVLRGRAFTLADRKESEKVILVNQAFARQVFGDADPLGRRIKNAPPETEAPWQTIVGVVGNTSLDRLGEEASPQTFDSWMQSGEAEGGAFRAVSYVVRGAGGTAALLPAVRAEVARLDPEQVIRQLAAMPQIVHESLYGERFRTWLLLAFAVTALLLSAIGIAGVTAVAVTQRRHEIGLRMALGADRGRILGEILGGGLRLVLAGVALGVAGGLALARLVAGLLYGVAATNPATFLVAAALLVLTGLLASYFPARRAAAVDPMVALRQE